MNMSSVVAGNGVIVFKVEGEVDVATAGDLLDFGTGLLSSSECDVLQVDLGAVDFMDSAGLGALIVLRNRANDSNQKLILRRPSARVERVLAITGLTTVFAR